ncbi:hypothetical protein JD844_019811 [Phrynosoma platyrhinos]|uniref:medium-chain acyl-CoA ligase n=1 Tax=Phrynosoma platyrhinos TaxID=52577 RepID=A0ABQ7TR76_PHRPL|nr:hypothetical protein JD844_019811 [Phrynosoma platyrhinos]
MACITLTLTILWKAPSLKVLRTLGLASTRCFSKHQLALAAQNFSDYESIQEQYKPEVPEYFNFAKDVVDKWAKAEMEGKRLSNPALWWVSEGDQVKWSFVELSLISKKVARVLSDHCSLKKGDRVIVILPRIPEWWLLNVACIRTGTILIPATTQLTAKDILHRLQTSQARCIIADQVLAPAVDSVASECPSLESKLIVSREPREGWLDFNHLLKLAPAEHNCVVTKTHDPMAIYFTSGTTGAPKMTEHSHGSHGIGLGINGKFWLDLTPSDIMWNTSDTGWAKSAWSSVFAPWIQGACVFVHSMPRFEPKPVLETLSKFPITTFCSPPTAYRMLVQHKLTSYKFHSLKHCLSAGEPMNPEVMEDWKTETGLDIYEGYGQTETIIDEEGNILPSGKEGDIAIRIKPTRPFCLFTQYTDDPERTASTIRGNFYITGDRGIKDEDGYFWFVGRADDVEFVPHLPKTISGKIRRNELRKKEWGKA